ncbi:hypothetical protein B484DRAFT_462003, partial [Ochromonadaceae sp. CCMP2298]
DGDGDDKGKGKEDKGKGKDDKEKTPRQKGCAYCTLQQLGVKNQAGEVLACRKAEFLTHIPDIKAISKAYAVQCAKAAIRTPDLLKIAEEAIEAYTDFRKGPCPNARGWGKRGARSREVRDPGGGEPRGAPMDQPQGGAGYLVAHSGGTGVEGGGAISLVAEAALAPVHADVEVPLLDPGPPLDCTDVEAEDSDGDEVIREDVDDLCDSFLPPYAASINALVQEMQQLFPSSRDPVLAARAQSEAEEAYSG